MIFKTIANRTLAKQPGLAVRKFESGFLAALRIGLSGLIIVSSTGFSDSAIKIVPGVVTLERLGGVASDGSEGAETLTVSAKVFEVTDVFGKISTERSIPAKNPSWSGFFEQVSEAERALRLWRAIEGMTQTAAFAIVRTGLMNTKPRSWAGFETSMRLMQQLIQENFYHAVCINNKEVNQKNLFAQVETIQVDAWTKSERLVKEISATVKVTLKGMELSFPEFEKIEIQFDGRALKVLTSETAYHKIVSFQGQIIAKGQYTLEIIGGKKDSGK